MKRHWRLIIGVAVVVIVAAGVGGFLLGDIQSVKGITVTRATPDQLAEAIGGDRFYSTYRKSALLVTGTVTAVSRRGGHLIVGFRTDSAYGAECDLGTAVAAPRVGDTLSVVTVGQAAERLPSAVLLHDCVVP